MHENNFNKNLLSLILHWFKPSFISIFTYDEFIVKNHKTQSQKKVWLASVSKLHVMFQSQTAQPKTAHVATITIQYSIKLFT